MFRKIFIVVGKRIPYRHVCLFCVSACGEFLNVVLIKLTTMEPIKYEFGCNWVFGYLVNAFLAEILEYVYVLRVVLTPSNHCICA
jgi:hypothetical protein